MCYNGVRKAKHRAQSTVPGKVRRHCRVQGYGVVWNWRQVIIVLVNRAPRLQPGQELLARTTHPTSSPPHTLTPLSHLHASLQAVVSDLQDADIVLSTSHFSVLPGGTLSSVLLTAYLAPVSVSPFFSLLASPADFNGGGRDGIRCGVANCFISFNISSAATAHTSGTGWACSINHITPVLQVDETSLGGVHWCTTTQPVSRVPACKRNDLPATE